MPEDVREIVLPLGATIHMDGSCLAAIMKIAVLFSLYGYDFSGPTVLAGAVGVALLCGLVMSGIPGGGFLGEALIVSIYGFGPEALWRVSDVTFDATDRPGGVLTGNVVLQTNIPATPEVFVPAMEVL